MTEHVRVTESSLMLQKGIDELMELLPEISELRHKLDSLEGKMDDVRALLTYGHYNMFETDPPEMNLPEVKEYLDSCQAWVWRRAKEITA